MYQFKSPAEPANFQVATKKVAEAVATAIARKVTPSFEESVWKNFAALLSQAQHQKCGYCECKVPKVTDPDVEHFHPKAKVTSLSDDPKDWGRDEPYLPRLRGRKQITVSPRGYWWLAYRWENYLLACGVCNRKYKLNIFPVLEPTRAVPPRMEVRETALLLNPYRGPEPVEHLQFDNIGAIEPRNGSRYGWETIKTCGLNRSQLRDSRLEKARRIHRLMDEFLATPNAPRQVEILRDIAEMGQEAYEHCGMVRAVFLQRSGLAWQEIESRLAARAPPPAAPPP